MTKAIFPLSPFRRRIVRISINAPPSTMTFQVDDFSFLEKEKERERESKRRKKSDVPDFSFLETNRSTSRNRDGLVSLSPMVIRLIERKRSQRNVNGGGASLTRRIVIRANFPASVLGSIGGTILSDERQRHLFFSCAMFDFSFSFEPYPRFKNPPQRFLSENQQSDKRQG